MGATGSIGQQTADVVRSHPDQFKIVALSAGKNIELVRTYIQEFEPKLVSVQTEEDYHVLKSEFSNRKDIEFMYGDEGLTAVAVYGQATILVNAVIGSVGLYPTLQAIKAKKDIAIANKETLVTAGHLVLSEAKKRGSDCCRLTVSIPLFFRHCKVKRKKYRTSGHYRFGRQFSRSVQGRTEGCNGGRGTEPSELVNGS